MRIKSIKSENYSPNFLPEVAFLWEDIKRQLQANGDWFHLYPELYPRQTEASLSAKKFRLYGWAKWGWKSHWLRSEVIRQCLSWANIHWLVLRRTRPEVWNNTIKYLLKEIPEKFTLPSWKEFTIYQYNDQKSTMTFWNWSTITFWYCKNMKDVLQYQGVQYDFIWIEEVTHWTFEEWKLLMGSLRIHEPWVVPNFFWTTNPWWRGHEWVKRLWIDRNFKDAENPNDYDFIPASVWDNEFIMKNQPDYVKDLESLPETLRRAFLEGDWDVFDWQYFKEFRRELHVVENYIPMVWVKKRIIAFDYWYAAPSWVYWIALMNSWKAVIYRELYVTEHTYKKLWTKMKALTTRAEKIEKTICDPAIYSKRADTNASTWKDDFKSVWVSLSPWKNNRVDWWKLFREFMQPFEDPNSWDVISNLEITENCVNLIRTIPLMLHDERNVEDLDTKLEDHALDGVRYWLMDFWVAKTGFSDIKKLNNEMTKKKVSTKTAEFWKKRNKVNLMNKWF